ncbi:hypothetical protein CJF30_00010801 [Rutstroemia sp. NJR-2017a BBW]|nr:hypothetical protein CJF30_00010801 [Rutstroemia sp. NJR-2017a BBW]
MNALVEERLIVFDFKSSLKMWLRLTPEPALLYVNQESKHHASKYFKHFICRPQTISSESQAIHFNLDNDICYFITPKGIHDNEKMYTKMCTFFDDNCVPHCTGVRPRRWAFDVKLLISREVSVEYHSIMSGWIGCVLKRMSWCHVLLGDEQVDEFCIMINDEEISDTIHQSDELRSVKIARDFAQGFGQRLSLETAKNDFQNEIFVCINMKFYRDSNGCPKPPIVSFGMIW